MRTQAIGNGLLTARIPDSLATVLAALQLQGADLEKLASMNDAGWQRILAVCERTHLTLPLALRSSSGFPAWVQERLRGNLADAAGRFVLAQTTYREIAATLNDAGIPYLVLKGFTQTPDFVKAPQFRMQSDIDLYTRTEFLTKAVSALESIGYESSSQTEMYQLSDHVPTLTRFGGWKPDSNQFDPEMPPPIDLHFCLWNERVSLVELPEVDDFWKRRIERRLGQLSFPALVATDHLGYFALHILRELFGGGGQVLHHARELASFLHERAQDVAFWREWQSLHSPRLRQIQAIPMALSGAAFSSRLPTAIQEEIELLPATQRSWMETCGGNLLTKAFDRTRDGRLLQLQLADSGRRRLLWNTMSPGTISSPKKVAVWPQHAVIPPIRHKRRLGKYPAYLASRIYLNSMAVLRVLANGLTILTTAGRRRTHYQ